ncbi:41704_t:CDS:2 [Gigaspora margarita]|uniref:41704_t:CDS:1 n=1 Tax=Gigaspora margarita TaxID=4874 RepID=A0ABN7W9S4_GIGMA|nr:41704_t:CDS:2 [Gigaspora margarita]
MCRELFSEFVSLLSELKSGSRWISCELSKDSSFLENLYKISTLSKLPSQHHGVISSKTKGWFDNESNFSSISSENILTPGERLQWLNREVQMIDRLIDFAIVILENANDKDIQSRWDTTIFGNSFFKAIAKSLFYFETLRLDLLYSGGNE